MFRANCVNFWSTRARRAPAVRRMRAVSRAAVWTVAGAALLAAVVLTLLGLGDNAGGAPELAGAHPGARPGRDRAAADLLVGPPDPRSVARRLGVPEGARCLQPDVRRLAAPGDARRGRRLLLARTSSGSPQRGSGSIRRRRIETADERIAWCVAAATIPAAIVGAVGENLIAERLGEPWQIAILLAVFGGRPLRRRPAAADEGDGGHRPQVGGRRRARAVALR